LGFSRSKSRGAQLRVGSIPTAGTIFQAFQSKPLLTQRSQDRQGKGISQKKFSGSVFSGPNLSSRSLRLGVGLAFEPETCKLKLFLFQLVLI
jgi:hypothetical protein